MSEATIAITASFTAEPVRLSLSSWARALNYPHVIEFTPYGQVLQSLVDPKTLLATASGGVNVILLRLEDWAQSEPSRLSERGLEFCDAVISFVHRSACPILICLCPDSPELDKSIAVVIDQVQQEIVETLSGRPGIHLLTSRELLETYPVGNYFDIIANRTAHVPYSPEFYTSLGTMLARRIDAIGRKPMKVIVVDCDNTLWSGVCGELGPRGVCIEDGHRQLQRRLIQLRDKGMLLALCSKNSESDVWDVFQQNDSMLLQREQIAAAEINWNSKSSNLRRLANKLGVSTDSFVLLDDNPVEIAEVRANCPAVVAIRVPEASVIPSFLDHVWAFDLIEVTDDDQKRSEQYRIETRRQEDRQKCRSMRNFLENLELHVRFQEVNEKNLDRIAQLTQRTNQFNSTLRRRTAAEVRQILGDPSHTAVAVEVSDKFGDYGLVGFVQCRRQAQSLCIDSFILSCRALGRGVEYYMLRHIGRIAREESRDEVHVPLVQGNRNQPAADFLKSFGEGFGLVGEQGVEYHFPVNLICELNPLSARENADDSTGNDPGSTTAEGFRANAQILGQIASDFQTVDQVLGRLAQEAAARPDLLTQYEPPSGDLECELVEICSQTLHLLKVGSTDSLHDLGATSLQLVQIHSQVVQQFDTDLSITDLCALPTVRDIAERIGEPSQASCRVDVQSRHVDRRPSDDGIAIVGMAGRFPGADNISQFWDNLINGVNSIVEIPEVELNLPADSPLRTHPNLVRKTAAVRDADKFDASFFGIFPKEAQVMDPQHRLMLEACWHAIEDAGYCPDRIDGSVGVFAGCYMNTYILANLATNRDLLASLTDSFHFGDLRIELGADKDHIATRISFLLDLCGPSITVQTSCSTSLVAVVQACQAIRSKQCDMALAGGCFLDFPQNRGYLSADGFVSPDGRCMTFDAGAQGTVFGEGVGAVLLKRVEDAIAHGDDIYGVIRGCGINNDGRTKQAYTAPSVEGQAKAVRLAHQCAGIDADTVTYVEAHGTGTLAGDPVEIEALTKAFRATTQKKQYCAIGSLKPNIGHLDVAAGVAGLIKCCLAVREGVLPPTLHYERANPKIDFENSPFYVVSERQSWDTGSAPRRAGLSSFGMGGTNAHIVVEQPPAQQRSKSSGKQHALILSARSIQALDEMTGDLAKRLQQEPDLELADAAYTLQIGRKRFDHTRVLVADSVERAKDLLLAPAAGSVFTHYQKRGNQPVAFMFPGQGSQHVNMARHLYQEDAVFRARFDECREILRSPLGFDLKEKIFLSEGSQGAQTLNQTGIAQPAIFAVSYSLAKRLEQLGVVPEWMIGHSVGEFVAACLAGVFSLPDALRLIAFRAERMQRLPSGSMIAIRISESELSGLLDTDLEIAAINGPDLCVVSGPSESIDLLQEALDLKDVICRPLHTSHAFHSAMMEPVVTPFADHLKTVTLREPEIPIISSVTGEVLSAQQATDPMYWARHLTQTVRFTEALENLLTQSDSVLLEVGAGQTLGTLARQHAACPKDRVILSTCAHSGRSTDSASHFMLTLGRLWQSGVTLKWPALYEDQQRKRVHLPTYPFERIRHWFEEASGEGSPTEQDVPAASTPPAHHDTDAADSNAERISLNFTSSITEQVIAQQLEIMKQQLDAWNQ